MAIRFERVFWNSVVCQTRQQRHDLHSGCFTSVRNWLAFRSHCLVYIRPACFCVNNLSLAAPYNCNFTHVAISRRFVRSYSKDNEAVLKINKTQPRDTGQYSCVAVNKHGTVTTTANVTIQGQFRSWKLQFDLKAVIGNPFVIPNFDLCICSWLEQFTLITATFLCGIVKFSTDFRFAIMPLRLGIWKTRSSQRLSKKGQASPGLKTTLLYRKLIPIEILFPILLIGGMIPNWSPNAISQVLPVLSWNQRSSNRPKAASQWCGTRPRKEETCQSRATHSNTSKQVSLCSSWHHAFKEISLSAIRGKNIVLAF